MKNIVTQIGALREVLNCKDLRKDAYDIIEKMVLDYDRKKKSREFYSNWRMNHMLSFIDTFYLMTAKEISEKINNPNYSVQTVASLLKRAVKEEKVLIIDKKPVTYEKQYWRNGKMLSKEVQGFINIYAKIAD